MKVLIITYYWPPAGGPGVQRVLKFAKYLPEFGWEPVILTVENGEFPAIDESLMNDIPEGIKVYKTKTLEPFNLYKKLLKQDKNDKIGTFVLAEKQTSLLGKFSNWLRRNLFIPDARMGWISYATKKGIQIVKEENIDAIFSSSPPHSLQIAAMKIAKKTRVKWISDFRDPWSEIVFNQEATISTISKVVNQYFEHKVMNSCDGLITVSPSIGRTIKSKLKHNKDIAIIPNGYDFTIKPITNTADIFTITYTGVMSDTRIPWKLFSVLGELKHEGYKFKLKLVGNISTQITKLIVDNNIHDMCVIEGYKTHSAVIEDLSSSDALLLVIDNVPDNLGILTGKLFEYIGMQKPILAIGNIKGDAYDIIEKCNCGKLYDYNDSDGMKTFIKQIYRAKQNKEPIFDFTSTECYSRKNLAQELAKYLSQITNNENNK